jgi:P4 family phage/plasmid primase-like protien
MTENSNELLEGALGYARRGWLVLPLLPNRKTPINDAAIGFEHGYKDATSDESLIRAAWTRHPAANIGLIFGAVVDSDTKGGKDGAARLADLEKQYGALPETLTAVTLHGKHQYFNYPDAWNDVLIKAEYLAGVDIKAKPVYVVAPPSVVNGFTYNFIDKNAPVVDLPDAWIEAAIKPEPTPSDWHKLEQPRGAGPSICEEYKIRLSDVMTIPRDAKRTSNGYLFKHPMHGATGDGNLSVNLERDVWKCFRCDAGGDALTWLAVREGFIDCADAGPLDRETIRLCLEHLRKEGRIPDEATVRAIVTTTTNGAKKDSYTVKLRRLDDIANVERFLSIYQDKLRWCEDSRRWLKYNGAYWTNVSSDHVKRCARDVASIIRHESALIEKLRGKSDEDKEKLVDSYNAWARTSSYKNRIDAVIELVKADLGVSINDFDSDPLLYNCENGTFDIRTGETRPFDPNDHITGYFDTPYEPNAIDEKWQSFLEKVQPGADMREFLQRAVGYSLTGLTSEEALFFGYGDGATGKSTFAAALLLVAASYGDVAKFATFLADRSTSGGAPREDIARLIGRRTAVCNEVNKNTRFNGALLRTFTSGDPFNARVPFSPVSITFTPIFKLWLFANDRPKIDYDDAAFRRFYVIPFNVVIPEAEQDKGLRDYFKTDKNAKKAILAWALNGAVKWYNDSKGGVTNGLRAPAEVIAATAAYKMAMNPVYEFIINECVVGCGENCEPLNETTAALWDAFDSPRAHYDIRKVKSSAALSKQLSKLGFESFRESKGAREYKHKYIRLIAADEVGASPAWFADCSYKIRPYVCEIGTISESPYKRGGYLKVCDMCLNMRTCRRIEGIQTNGVEASQSETIQEIKAVMESWRDAARYNKKAPIERDIFINAVAMAVCKKQSPNGIDEKRVVDVERLVETLSGEDREISAIVADVVR